MRVLHVGAETLRFPSGLPRLNYGVALQRNKVDFNILCTVNAANQQHGRAVSQAPPSFLAQRPPLSLQANSRRPQAQPSTTQRAPPAGACC